MRACKQLELCLLLTLTCCPAHICGPAEVDKVSHWGVVEELEESEEESSEEEEEEQEGESTALFSGVWHPSCVNTCRPCLHNSCALAKPYQHLS